jgi:hypothetical protein
MAKKKHWRDLLQKAYLHGSEIDGEITVTIKDFEEIEVYSKREQSKEDLGVMTFEEDVKPVVLTSRKCEAMEQLFGSGNIYDWVGKKITMYPKDERHFGKMFPVITIKAANAKANVTKSPLLINGEKWSQAVDALANGQTTIQGIKKHYSLTSKAEAELKKQANDLQTKSK